MTEEGEREGRRKREKERCKRNMNKKIINEYYKLLPDY